MNNEQQQIIDDTYKRYVDWVMSESNQNNKNEIVKIPESKERFINNTKTNEKFSEKWGLKIVERKLSLEERYNLIEEDKHTQFLNWQSLGTDRIKEVLDEKNIPTKLITVTYNNKTIESYES